MMTMHFSTGDRVVDCVLVKMQGLSTWPEDAKPESVHDLLVALIGIQRMLPEAVARHFSLPNLYTGSSHYTGGDAYRRDLVNSVTTALKSGLVAADADAALKRGGGADLASRPVSRGEVIIEALEEFERDLTPATLARLRNAVSPTGLQGRIGTIEMLMSRKRPYANLEPYQAILSELHRLRHEAEIYHSEMA